MKFRASTKILVGFIGLIGLGYGATYGYTRMRLIGVDLHPIASSDICLIAIDKKAGAKVITANQMVQLVESSDKFGGDSSIGGGAESGAVKRRIPVKELVGVLGGDPVSAQSFIRKMRDYNEENESNEESPLWLKADLQRAIDGDPVLKPKLEHDLSCTLEGVPNKTLNRLTFFYGIRVKVPLILNIPNSTGKAIDTFDVVTFKPRFMNRFYKFMQEKFYDKNQLQSYYTAFLADDKPDNTKIGDSLNRIFSSVENSQEFAKVRTISSHSVVLVNQSMIESMKMAEESDGKVTTYDLKLHLTSEGKNRLWKFSAEGGKQLLVVSKGVAIAAALIGTQLNSEELVIKQIADRRLVEEAVNLVETKH